MLQINFIECGCKYVIVNKQSEMENVRYVVHIGLIIIEKVNNREIIYFLLLIRYAYIPLCIMKWFVRTIFVISCQNYMYAYIYLNVQVLLMCVYVQTYRSKVSFVYYWRYYQVG